MGQTRQEAKSFTLEANRRAALISGSTKYWTNFKHKTKTETKAEFITKTKPKSTARPRPSQASQMRVDLQSFGLAPSVCCFGYAVTLFLFVWPYIWDLKCYHLYIHNILLYIFNSCDMLNTIQTWRSSSLRVDELSLESNI